MKLSKQDLMRLPKERLAELLVEMQEGPRLTEEYKKWKDDLDKQLHEKYGRYPSAWGCDGTVCTNPHMDCINCPRKTTGGVYINSPNTTTSVSTLKAEGKQ